MVIFAADRHHRIEVHRGLSINEIAEAIALPRFDDRDVAGDGALEHERSSVELALLFFR